MTPASPEPMRRLFIGLMLDPAPREALLAWRARWQWPHRSALSSPAHLHLTVHFLGDTPESRLPALAQGLGAIRAEPFRLRLGRPEAWPRGLVVLRPDPQPRLDALHHQVLRAVAAAGLEAAPAETWKPHVTLARRAPGAVPPADAPAIEWAVDAFSLVWSRLPPQVPRARYEELGRWKLLTE